MSSRDSRINASESPLAKPTTSDIRRFRGMLGVEGDVEADAGSTIRKDRLLVQDAKERLRGSYFAGFVGLYFRSLRSLLRPKARLLAARSSKEMKCTGTPKKVLATLFLQAAANSTPVISVRMSMRTGAIPI